MTRTIICLVLISCFSVYAEDRQASKPHLTKQTAIEVGMAALKAKYPTEYEDLVAEHGPFAARLRDGVWSVYGTNPKGVLGGGAPVIEFRDHDQKLLRIYFAR